MMLDAYASSCPSLCEQMPTSSCSFFSQAIRGKMKLCMLVGEATM